MKVSRFSFTHQLILLITPISAFNIHETDESFTKCAIDKFVGKTHYAPLVTNNNGGLCIKLDLFYGGTVSTDPTNPSCANTYTENETNVYSKFQGINNDTALFNGEWTGEVSIEQAVTSSGGVQAKLKDFNPSAKTWSLSLVVDSCTSPFVGKKKKPNIMIILADDVGTGDVPGYFSNNEFVSMPNLEYLLGNGTTFTDAHSTPLCAPSRYVLLSGNYQYRGEVPSGTWNINYKGNQFRDGQKSIAQVLRDEGYNTAMFGKWHLGGKLPLTDGFVPPPQSYYTNIETMISNEDHNWTKPMEQGPWDIGFNHSYITLAGIQNPPYIFLRNNLMEDLGGPSKDNIKYWVERNHVMPYGTSIIRRSGEGSKDWDSTAYNMILVNETEKFLDDHLVNAHDKPFFTYVALGSAHVPHSPPDKYIDGSTIAGKHATKHLDMLSEMDKVVGSLISILDDRNLTEDTIIIFTSDNGGLGGKFGSNKVGHESNGPLRANKGSIYEGGHRIPLTIRWDNGGIPKGENRSSHFVGLNDIYATLCDFADVDIPFEEKVQAIDSISFAKYALNKNKTDGLRTDLWTRDYKGNIESIREGNMKLIHHIQSGTLELYDLSRDLSESTNIISYAHKKVVRQMYIKLKEIGPCATED